MKLWDKDIAIDALIEGFTIGNDPEYDLLLARYDVQASRAHAEMLCAIGLLQPAELEQIQKGLSQIAERVQQGTFVIEPGVEDVHSQIELDLTRLIGEDGKKIHAGRSRNDQVLVALKLFYKAQLHDLIGLLKSCAQALLQQAKQHEHLLMPGYTHSQVGMVSSFGLWFSAFAEALIDDARYLKATLEIIDQNPLGSAAGYGNSFPLDREMTTRLLGFRETAINAIHAQMGRGKTELLIGQALAAFALTTGKLAADVCLFTNGNFALITLPDALTTGSSIMPHKKNPDVFELIRAKSNQLLALPAQVAMLTNSLMSGYHRDFQQLKELVFPALATAQQTLRVLAYCIPQIQPAQNALDDARYDYLFSVEAVNALVLDGTPFRDAYKTVALQIADGSYKPLKNVAHTHLGSIGRLGLEEIAKRLEQL